MVHELTDMAQQILEKRYIHEKLGETSWKDVVNRVVNEIWAEAPDKVYKMLLERYFLPNSPTLVNAGTKIKGYAACYVLPLEDSLESIYKTKYNFAKVCQKGGGCGTTLSHIRPEGMNVAGSTHSKAAGPLKFAETICKDMSVLSQAGFRDMAIMLTMDVSHPDVEEFIICKDKEGKLNNANISVMVTDDFMAAVIKDMAWQPYFKSEMVGPQHKAKDIFNTIVRQAWKNGEPGLLFEDAINDSPYKYTGQYITATNPCGEQPLPPFGVCTLGSIDVSKFYISDVDSIWWEESIDFEHLKEVINLAIEFLDRINELSEWPIPEIAEWVKKNNPIGLGVMGFVDLLLKLGIEYGSPDSIAVAELLSAFITGQAIEKSIELGKELGVPEECQKLPEPRRNITVTTVAPTGSLALIAGCSHGIEPIFSPSTYREDNTGSYETHHPLAGKSHFKSAINDNPDKVITWKEHIDIQAAWQKFIDSAISKTINLPNSATVEDIKNAFIYAWESGCKGVTVYRDGSRNIQVLNTEKSVDFESRPVTYERPAVLESKTVRLRRGNENIYVTVGHSEGKPKEVFVNTASVLLHDVQIRDGISRLSSLALKYNVPIEILIKELRQIPAQSIKSVPASIALVLEMLADVTKKCPDCGANVIYGEGCLYCNCGWSKCG